MRNAVTAALIAIGLGGCCTGPEYSVAPNCPPQEVGPIQTPAALQANPIFIPIADHQQVWEQVVDVVDDYFRIEHEEPVRPVGNLMTEGNLTTFPEVSPTIFEPWRYNTADPEQRLENTLQSMRRRAAVRVIPASGGHLVEVLVFKDLEDVIRPENSTAGAATFRYDSTLTGVTDPIGGEYITKGWIPRGRDTVLEQYMIGDLLCRSGAMGAPTVVRGQDMAGRR